MAKVTVTHIERGISLGLPYIIYIDGQPVGMMQMPQARMQLPEGKHWFTVKCGGVLNIPFTKRQLTLTVESTSIIDCQEDTFTEVRFENREKWWNIIFDIDLILWFLRLFMTLPEPWGMVYDIVSNLTFAVWLFHFWLYRKKYFRIIETKSATPPTEIRPTKWQQKFLRLLNRK